MFEVGAIVEAGREQCDVRITVEVLVRNTLQSLQEIIGICLDRRHAVLGREVRFSSLLPGRWLLVVELDGRVVERREFDLRTGVVHSYVIRLPASGKREEVES